MNDRLFFIMKKLRITEKKLGELVSVDKSLVNKWKNQKRSFLNSLSLVVDAIAKIFEDSPSNIKSEFLSLLPATHPKDGRELIYWFFTTPDFDIADLETSEITLQSVKSFLWDGDSQLPNAFARFFKQIENFSNGSLKIFFSDYSLYPYDKDIRLQIVNGIKSALSRDITINFFITTLYTENEIQPNFITDLVNFSFNPNFNLNIIHKSEVSVLMQNYMVYNDEVAIIMRLIKNQNTLANAEIYLDKTRCGFLNAHFRTLLVDRVPLFKSLSFKNASEAFEKYKQFDSKTSISYAYAQVPFIFIFSKALFTKIFNINKININERTRIIREYNMVNYESNASRNIFCMQDFENLLSQEEIYMPLLSAIAGKDIMISREIMSEILEEWIKAQKNSKNEIMLTPEPIFDYESDYGCYVKQYYFSIFWKICELKKKILYTLNVQNTQVFYNILKKTWEKQADFVKDKALTFEYLENIVAKLKNSFNKHSTN